VGATIGAIALLGFFWWLFRNFKVSRKQRPSRDEADVGGQNDMPPGYMEAYAKREFVEAPPDSVRPHEVDGENVRHELDGGVYAPEMAENKRFSFVREQESLR
jgi:hypothetical protein